MSYTLLVIDVQPYFDSANSERVVRNCRREIRQAMKDKAAVLLVEYDRCGDSNKSLAKMVKKYDRGFIVKKAHDDGSSEIKEIITRHRLPKSRIKVTGVNTNACVQGTVKGLVAKSKSISKRFNISVIADACNSCTEAGHIDGLRYMSELNNVKLINDRRWQRDMKASNHV